MSLAMLPSKVFAWRLSGVQGFPGSLVPLVTEFLVCRSVLILQPAVGKKHLHEGLDCGYNMDADLLQPTGGAVIGFHRGLQVATRTMPFLESSRLLEAPLPLVQRFFDDAIPSSRMVALAEDIFAVMRALLHSYQWMQHQSAASVTIFCRIPYSEDLPEHYIESGGIPEKIRCLLCKKQPPFFMDSSIDINMGLVPGKYHDLPYFHGSVRSDGSIFLSQQSSNATEELLVALVTIGHVLKGRAIVRDEYSEVEHFNVSLCFQ